MFIVKFYNKRITSKIKKYEKKKFKLYDRDIMRNVLPIVCRKC